MICLQLLGLKVHSSWPILINVGHIGPKRWFWLKQFNKSLFWTTVFLKSWMIFDSFWSFSIPIWQSLTCSPSCGIRNPPPAEELVLSRAEDETEILRSQNKELKEVAKNNESKRWIEVTWFLRDPWMLDDVWFSFVWSLILVRDGEWKRMMDYDGLELHQRWPRMIVRLTYHHHSSSLIDIFRLTLKHPWGWQCTPQLSHCHSVKAS